jgi:hypothetical protein
MPEVPEDRFKTGLKVKEIASLFTVATFERMVLERLNQATGVLQSPSSEAFTPATV